MSADPLHGAQEGLSIVQTAVGLMKGSIGRIIPDVHGAANDFERIARSLLQANESLVRWIYKFRDFDVTAPNSEGEFRALAAEYRALKAGGNWRQMKFDCREIETIYNTNVRGRMREFFAADKVGAAMEAFEKLSTADGSLVEFIHEEVFQSLDRVCDEMEDGFDRNDLDRADSARLRFKRREKEMVSRLSSIGEDLVDIILQFRDAANMA